MIKYLFIILPFFLLFFAPDANAASVEDFIKAARNQVGITLQYDPAYQTIDYPNGDIPVNRGVCTDVVIRALRSAYQFDLQQAVHEDMKRNFLQYPQHWNLNEPDKNIDHRRVPNLQTFFARQDWDLILSKKIKAFRAGDIVTCIVPPHLPHIMVISDRKNDQGIPLVIHNIGAGTQEEDRLLEFKLTGHYRVSGI